MKQTARRILSAILCGALLIPAMVSCKIGNPEDDIPSAVLEKVSHVYRGSYIAVPESISLSSDDYALTGDSLSFIATETLYTGDPETREGYESQRVIYSVPLTGGEGSVIPLPQKLRVENDKQSVYLGAIALGADGSTVIHEQLYDQEKGAHKHLLTSYAADGTELFSVDPEPLNQERTDPMESMRGFTREYSLYINKMVMGGNGTLYIATEFSVIAVSPAGERLYEIPVNGYIQSLSATTDGKVLCSYTDYGANYENRLVFMDDEKRGFSEPITIPSIDMRNMDTYMGEGYDFYLKSDTGLYGFNQADAEPTLLCNWINSDISASSIRSLIIIDADRFVYTGRDPVTRETEVAIMTRLSEEEIPAKYLIRLVGNNLKYNLPGYIVKFNRTNEQYRIVAEDYNQYRTDEDYQAGQKKLEEEILAGKVPDILVSGSYDSFFSNLADKGVFVDLYTLMDSDPAFERTALLPCVQKPFETDGKLYQIPSFFALSGFAGKTKNVAQYKGSWTIDTLLSIVEQTEQGGPRLISEMYRDMLSDFLLTANLGSFIDYENATCNFNSDAFIKTLEFLKSLPTREQFYAENDRSELRANASIDLREDKILLTQANFYSFSDYLQQKAVMLMEDITLLGMLSPEGGNLAIAGQVTYSIGAKSPVQAGAWEFVKYMFSDEVMQGSDRYHSGFPATYAGLQAVAENEMKMYYLFDLDGSGWGGSSWDGVTPPNREYDPEKEIPGYLTQADVDALIHMLETEPMVSNLNAGADEKLNALILEEVGAYYAGNATVEETVNKIQSRVSIYLAEKS